MSPATVAAGSDPVSITVDPTGQFAYVANQLSDDVSQYGIEANGTLSALSPATVAAGSNPRSVTAGPTGEFVYVVNRLRSDAVFHYRIEASGTLTARSTRPAGTLPESVAVDPSGQFAYVVNSGSDDVSQYSIMRTARSAH